MDVRKDGKDEAAHQNLVHSFPGRDGPVRGHSSSGGASVPLLHLEHLARLQRALYLHDVQVL